MNAPPILLPPGQMRPGDRITWITSPGHGEPSERAGDVWSLGPQPRTLWVIPDGEPGDRKPVLIYWRCRDGHGCYEQALVWPQGGAA